MSPRRGLLIPGVLALAGCALWFWLTPSHDRLWSTDQSVLPAAEIHDDTVTIRGVRNFRWTSETTFTPAWEERTYRLDQLATAWYVLVPFSQKWRGPAHAFVSFGFDDGRYLSISVEARRERGERYGVLKGMLRRFELVYVVGDERDLIGRRAVYDNNDVFLYPIKAGRPAVRAMFTDMLARVNALHERPEFYNTFSNNCTLNLVRHVNRISPGRIPSSWRVVFPGYSDEVALSLGLIDSTLALADARAKFRINDQARAALDSAEFSRLIRQSL
jgi:hypothetical protein